LIERFPAAHDFLRGLEVLCEGDHGFHMGTARHVQCYFEEGFLFHLAILDADTATPRLELSPRHHGRLKEGTYSASDNLFRDRIHQVVEQLRLPGKAVMRHDEAYHIGPETPLIFFRLLQGELLDIVAQGTTGPAQQELFGGAPKKRRKRRKGKKGDDGSLQDRARSAEAAVAAYVRDLEAHFGAGVTVELGPDGASVSVPIAGSSEPAVHRAESLAEAVASAEQGHSDRAVERAGQEPAGG